MAQRTRSRNGSSVILSCQGSQVYANGYTVPTLAGSRSFSSSEIMVDETTPGYFRMKRDGSYLPVNPMGQTALGMVTSTSGTWGYERRYEGTRDNALIEKHTYSGQTALTSQPFFQFPAFSPDSFDSPDENTTQMLYTGALANANTRQMDFLTFAAEWRQTYSLLSGALARTIRNLIEIRRILGNPVKGTKKTVELVSNAWMEYRYGWRLLAYDIEDIQEHIERLEKGFSDRWRGAKEKVSSVVVRNVDSTSSTMYSQSSGASGVPFRNRYTILEQHDVHTKVGVMVESVLRSRATIDPLVTLWEVIPLSFVVDWFFNVNNFLQAASPFADSSVLGSYQTVVKQRIIRVSTGPTGEIAGSGPSMWRPFGSASSATKTDTIYSRLPLSIASQSLTLGYDNQFDSIKGLDLAAIVFGRLKNIRSHTSY